MERADLAAAVGEELVGAHCAANHLVDVLRRLVLAIDFLVLAIGEFRSDQARSAGEYAEPAGGLAGQGGNLTADGGRSADRLGEHLGISSFRDDQAVIWNRIPRNLVRYLRGEPLRTLPEARLKSVAGIALHEGAPDMANEAVFEQRLAQYMADTGAGGALQNVHVRMPRDQDDWRGNTPVAQAPDQVEAVHVGHLVVDHEAIGTV